jgi:putative acetyltransferase
MQTTIRPYINDDLEAVLLAWETASTLAHPFLTAEFRQTERHNIPTVYLPAADTWVAEEDGQVIGFISLIGNEVGALFVQPAFHGKGVGRALMNQAKALHDELEVEVFAANDIGQNFYQKAGFTWLHDYLHEPTGQKMLRLKLSGEAITYR